MEITKKLPNDGGGGSRLTTGHNLGTSDGIRTNERNNINS